MSIFWVLNIAVSCKVDFWVSAVGWYDNHNVVFSRLFNAAEKEGLGSFSFLFKHKSSLFHQGMRSSNNLKAVLYKSTLST